MHVPAPDPYAQGLAKKRLRTRARAILSLEIRGHSKKDIAEILGLTPVRVIQITRTDRYLEERDRQLGQLDSEFIGMKPAAFTALDNALRSRDQRLALAACETWFRTSGFMQYGKSSANSQGLTAEDVAKQLMQVNIQVNVERGGGS